jgi:hypothetical protein
VEEETIKNTGVEEDSIFSENEKRYGNSTHYLPQFVLSIG